MMTSMVLKRFARVHAARLRRHTYIIKSPHTPAEIVKAVDSYKLLNITAEMSPVFLFLVPTALELDFVIMTEICGRMERCVGKSGTAPHWLSEVGWAAYIHASGASCLNGCRGRPGCEFGWLVGW